MSTNLWKDLPATTTLVALSLSKDNCNALDLRDHKRAFRGRACFKL